MGDYSLDLPLIQSDSIDATSFNRHYLPELASLWHQEYSIFGSLDFESPDARRPGSDATRTRLFRRLITAVAKQSPVHNRNLDYFVTDEWSDAREKHLHFLVRKHPRIESNIDAVLYSFKDVWENQLRAGHCVVKPYIPALRGVDYVCKRQYADGQELQKNPHCNRAFHERMVRDREEGRTPELKFDFNCRN